MRCAKLGFLFGVCLLTASGFSQVSFTYGGFPTTSGGNWVAVGDFANDDFPGLAVAESDRVEFFDNPGSAGFQSRFSFKYTSPSQVEFADINGDGNLDAIVASADGTGVAIFYSDGEGGFSAGPIIPTSQKVSEFEPAAFVTPGVVDIVTRECTNGSTQQCMVRFYKNNGSGVFATGVTIAGLSTSISGAAHRGLVAMDLNSDGKADLVVARTDGFDVRFGNGNGTFGTAHHYAVSGGVWSIAVGSLRNNSWLDLVVSATLEACGDNPCRFYAEAYLNNGAGTFALKSKNPIYGEWLVSTDLNNDGYADVVGIDPGHFSGAAQYITGNGNGYFAAAKNTDAADTGSVPVAADLNYDGTHDIAYAEYLPGDLKIAENREPAKICQYASAGNLYGYFCSITTSGDQVTIKAAGESKAGVVRLELWVDGKKQTETWNDRMKATFTTTSGTHRLTLVVVDKYGLTASSRSSVTVP